MSPPATRALLRQSRYLLRRQNVRHASTTAETATKAKEAAGNTASKAKDTASGAVSKASEGLSRVTSSGSSVVSGAASRASDAMNSVSGRTGRVISFVRDTLIPPTIYYSRVGLELSKIVFQGQKMAPPSLSQFQSYLQPVINVARNPTTITSSVSSAAGGTSPESILSSVRNVDGKQLISIGVVFAELLGFFTVGTMIGRMKVVGYHGETVDEVEVEIGVEAEVGVDAIDVKTNSADVETDSDNTSREDTDNKTNFAVEAEALDDTEFEADNEAGMVAECVNVECMDVECVEFECVDVECMYVECVDIWLVTDRADVWLVANPFKRCLLHQSATTLFIQTIPAASLSRLPIVRRVKKLGVTHLTRCKLMAQTRAVYDECKADGEPSQAKETDEEREEVAVAPD